MAKRLLSPLAILISALILSGCDNTVSDFVGGVAPVKVLPDSAVLNEPTQLKISPGSVTSKSADISMKATVTLTGRVLTGDGMSAQISVNRTKVTE